MLHPACRSSHHARVRSSELGDSLGSVVGIRRAWRETNQIATQIVNDYTRDALYISPIFFLSFLLGLLFASYFFGSFFLSLCLWSFAPFLSSVLPSCLPSILQLSSVLRFPCARCSCLPSLRFLGSLFRSLAHWFVRSLVFLSLFTYVISSLVLIFLLLLLRLCGSFLCPFVRALLIS